MERGGEQENGASGVGIVPALKKAFRAKGECSNESQAQNDSTKKARWVLGRSCWVQGEKRKGKGENLVDRE